MNKKYISEMSTEELKKVFEVNDKLRNEISDFCYDSEMYYVQDIINCFDRSSIDYRIGYDRGCYFRCLDEATFVEGVEEVQANFEFLSDDEFAIIANIKNLFEDEEEHWEEIEAECKELADTFHKHFENIFYNALCDDDYHLETWLDFYADEYYSDCYIDADDESYELFRDEIKSFKY